jgi:hypothetical protein
MISLTIFKMDTVDKALAKNEKVSAQACVDIKRSNGQIPKAVKNPTKNK